VIEPSSDPCARGHHTVESAERTRILTALTGLCAERGYRALELGLLLRRAGLGERQFHRHFRDLEDCFCTAVEEGTDALLLAVGTAALSAASCWRRQLRAVAYALLDFLLADPDRARLMVIEVPGSGPRAELIRDRGMQALATFVDLARAELADPDSVPASTAETTAGAIYNRLHEAIAAGRLDRPHGERMVSELMYTAVLPYMGREAALAELEVPPRAP
jgi:AcrR family transcriptional regulator